MALRISLKPYERILVNGAVIENGPRKSQISVLNMSDCLREADILAEDAAVTPVKRLYYEIQMQIVDRVRRDEWVERAEESFRALANVFERPDMLESLSQAALFMQVGDGYKALAKLRPVLAYERLLLDGHERPSTGAAVTQ